MLSSVTAALLPLALDLIPAPVQVRREAGELNLNRGVFLDAGDLQTYGEELLRRGGLRLDSAGVPLRIEAGSGKGESYRLRVTPAGARIDAESAASGRHGLHTFLQLIQGGVVPAVDITDRPRFGWRGLMLDTARHFLPVEDIERTLDGMAAVKLNVLHLHLTDDQGFRVESRLHPELTAKGSGGRFYSQEQVRRLTRYAAAHGIRIVPEFDLPGHTTALLAARPDLASGPPPAAPESGFGIFDAALDPSNEKVYEFLDSFLGEMAGLFPDPYVHVGGDEVTGKHWDANPRIAAFRRGKRLASNHELQHYFMARVRRILQRHGRKMIGWDEVVGPAIAKDVAIQAWRGANAILAAAHAGHPVIVSSGFYLDWNLPAGHAYRNRMDGAAADPQDRMERLFAPRIPVRRKTLTGEERKQILGGEACLWSEMITARNLHFRLWPRLGAVAERLWSPAALDNIDDLYRRLPVLARRLEAMRIPVETQYESGMRELAGSAPVDPLLTLASALDPAKYVSRVLSRRYTTDSPLESLADRIRAESLAAREFNARPNEAELRRWQEATLLARKLYSAGGIAEAASDVLEAVEIGLNRGTLTPKQRQTSAARLKELGDPRRELIVAIAPGVLRMLEGK
ncbi:MAG: beta-N-acetylhexosaminidase [Bryobacteraceae bacterium]|nr:beta-N-acetylhexosaminidase [Bryobacteraceae bacterium]